MTNLQDIIHLDRSLLIKILQHVKLQIRTDVAIHDLAEKLISLSSNERTLTDKDLSQILSYEEDDSEIFDMVDKMRGK